MTNLNRYIIGGLIALLLALGSGLWITKCTDNKTIAGLRGSLYACQHTPIQIHDSIYDSIVYVDRWHEAKPKPVPYPVYIDTIKPKYCSQTFEDSITVFSGKLHGVVKYRAVSKDCKLFINPYESRFPIDCRIETKTVLDTIPIYKPKFHWGFTIGANVNNFKSFPMFQTGLFVTLNDRIMILGGVAENPIDGHAYVNGQLGVFLDKRKN